MDRKRKSCPVNEWRQVWPLLFVFFVQAALSCGCGRKAPPVPSKVVVPEPVQDLRALISGDGIRLRWSIPIKDDDSLQGMKGFRLYHYKTTDADTLCRGCPIPFRDWTFFRLESPAPAVIEGGQVTYWDWYEPESYHAYKVVIYHRSGGVSDDSNIVLLVPSPDK